jgi:hypothetical protein
MTSRRPKILVVCKLQEEQQQLAGTISRYAVDWFAKRLTERLWFAVCALFTCLQDLLSNKQRQLQMVLQEAQAAADKHGTPRRSRIVVSTLHQAEFRTTPLSLMLRLCYLSLLRLQC